MTAAGGADAPVAVILARGLGTRMRREDPAALLDPSQSVHATAGLKAMIPDAAGRPFLDHLLSALADAAMTEVLLVVAPEHDAIRDHYRRAPPRRVRLEYAIQPEPLGTADALLAAQAAIGRRPFVVQNGDNLYPPAALRALVALGEPGLVAFARDALLAESNIPAERVAAFALLEVSPDGHLLDVVEKPSAATMASVAADAWVSMNLWRFDQRIFAACRDVLPSSRGERELPGAVAASLRQGARYRVVTLRAGVLDLSSRADVAVVARQLADREIDP